MLIMTSCFINNDMASFRFIQIAICLLAYQLKQKSFRKIKKSNRLGIPGSARLDTFKNSIISRVYSPQSTRRTTERNGKRNGKSNGSIILSSDKKLSSAIFRSEEQEDDDSKSSGAKSSLKTTEKLVEVQKKSTLVEVWFTDLRLTNSIYIKPEHIRS